jgi:hypothetical protein
MAAHAGKHGESVAANILLEAQGSKVRKHYVADTLQQQY